MWIGYKAADHNQFIQIDEIQWIAANDISLNALTKQITLTLTKQTILTLTNWLDQTFQLQYMISITIYNSN